MAAPGASSPPMPALTETDGGFRYLTLATELDLTALQRCAPHRYPYLLKSSAEGINGRYDILFAQPQQTLMLNDSGRLSWDGHSAPGGFLDSLEALYRQTQLPPGSSVRTDGPSFPFTGGWFLFLGYELAHEIEPSLAPRNPGNPLPMALACRIPIAVLVDHRQHCTSVIVENETSENDTAIVLEDIARARSSAKPEAIHARDLVEEDPRRYLDAIARTQTYIREGDIFQANLSRLWCGEVDADVFPSDIFASLCRANPAPFSGMALFGDRQAVISSSPERLVSVNNGVVSTRPIAGTHPRGTTAAIDRDLSSGLLQNPKERAEHIMLIDLERNDIGRVCETGSVKVKELMALESYTHVHHIVSEVAGRLRQDASPVDVIRAVFPGGTITGCPKVRCMEIIRELEADARGAYTGAMGYLDRRGNMDLNILIRTIVQDGNRISFRAGGGIVADSVPERELEETRAKAKGLLRAVGIAA